MKTCVIIDDEQHGADTLIAMLRARFADKIEVLGFVTDSRKAAALIREKNPQIVFMDVEMPHITGIQLLHSFPQRNFAVIFTTAYEQYALQAIKTGAADYLLKPISMEELGEAIEKVTTRLDQQQMKSVSNTVPQKLLLPASQGTLVANIPDIIRIESTSNYCSFHIVNKPKIVVSKTLKEYEELLTGADFFRVHQSHLVNLHFVEYFHPGPEEYVILTNGEQIEVSRRRKAEFLQRLASL